MVNGPIEHIPMVAGALATIQDPEDTRRNLTYGLGALMLILIVMESLGFSIGPTGQSILTMVPVLLAYIFGRKEAEAAA